MRTSWLYSASGSNFAKTMRRPGRERSQVSVVADQVGTPTCAREGALAVMELLHLACEVVSIPPGDFPVEASRPFYSVLSGTRWANASGRSVPHWREALGRRIQKPANPNLSLMKSILVTGGAGFIGSNFIPYFAARYPGYRLVNLDKLTYAGNPENLSECSAMPNYIFERGDITDAPFVDNLMKKYDVRGIIHFAAESHVDNSIAGPRAFVETNFVGTFTLLDAARRHWMSAPGTSRPGYEGCRFHHISTDEVYGSLGPAGAFSETTPYAPNSPYSASKAGSDFLVRSYFHTYGMEVTTSNCSNNYGPKQHGEKLIPTIIRQALAGEPIPIYGNGGHVRDWLYVLDHCKAIDLVFHRGRPGETYNVGGNGEKTNLEIVAAICALLDQWAPRPDGARYDELVAFVPDRPGHDLRYAIDFAKIAGELGWQPEESFETGIAKTVRWYFGKLS